MIEYAKYTLNIKKMEITDTEFEKKINTIFSILILLVLFFIVFLDLIENYEIWYNILGLVSVVLIFFIKTLFGRKSFFLKGEIDLEVKRDNFYFYKDGVMKLELLYKNTDVRYRKTIFNGIKMVMNDCGKIYCFYIKKDHNVTGYEKLYADLEGTDYHIKISILKEVIFNIIVLGAVFVYIIFG